MSKRLYVGNLPYSADDMTLRDLFSQHGTVESAQVATDRETGRSRGFGFVDMASDVDAEAAIQALNGYSMEGRPLSVQEARPRETASARGGLGRGGGRYH
jgi:RNA recognition motif-containing protein